jgi:hypothetical protein
LRFQERIRQVFRVAQEAVDEELTRQTAANGHDDSHSAANRNGHHNGNGHAARAAHAIAAPPPVRRVCHAITARQGLDLAGTLRQRYGIEQQPEQLAITEANQLIDELKGAANGVGGHR